MSTAAAAPAPRPSPPATDTRTARDRGHLVIEKTVVERIAAQVASESSTTGGTSGGFLGLGTHTDLTARPQATVELVDAAANISVDVTVAYPSSIRAATDRLRERITTRVQELTGIDVTRVDVTVTGLQRPTAPPRELR